MLCLVRFASSTLDHIFPLLPSFGECYAILLTLSTQLNSLPTAVSDEIILQHMYTDDYDLVNILTMIARILADILVLAATWYKTYRTVRQALNLRMNVGLSAVVFRDGKFVC